MNCKFWLQGIECTIKEIYRWLLADLASLNPLIFFEDEFVIEIDLHFVQFEIREHDTIPFQFALWVMVHTETKNHSWSEGILRLFSQTVFCILERRGFQVQVAWDGWQTIR